MMRRTVLTALTISLLILTGCSDSGDAGASGAPASGSPGESPAAVEPIGADDEVGPNGPWVQDLWVYESVRALDATGEEVDLTEEILAGLGTPSRTVDLPEGALFHVHDDLAGTITTDGTTRADVDVVAGVLEFEGSSNLAALATPAPNAERPIGLDDSVELDVTFLDDLLAPGDPLVVDFAFLQALPAADETAATGLDLLAARLAAGRSHYFGDESDETEESGEAFAFQSVLGEAVPGSTRMGAPGKGPISDPFMRGMNKGLACVGPPIRCLRKYFQKVGGGARGSNELLNCNLGPCGNPPPPVPEPTCIGLGCAPPKVRADPHVTSFDGLELSMQGVGEYVLARTAGLEVQMRTAATNPQSSASAVNMASMQAGDDRVVVQVEDSTLGVWVNDTQVPYDPATEFLAESQQGGLTVLRRGDDLQVTAADGSALLIRRSFGRWLDVGITLPEEHPGLVGLLGDADGDPENDWTARDGSVLPTDTTGRDLYTGFSDTWRVTQDESILRYGAGESTDTFTDLSFPAEVVTVADLDPALRARAEAVCRMAGVTDEPLLGQCTLDYALSGEIGFVRSAQDVVRAAEATSQSAGGSSSGGATSGWATTPGGSGAPQGTTFRHICPADGTIHSVWGGNNGVYTNDSSICVAAVHAGLISLADGGSVEVTRTPGLDDYGKGSTRNGVTTRDWEKSWSGSFTLAP